MKLCLVVVAIALTGCSTPTDPQKDPGPVLGRADGLRIDQTATPLREGLKCFDLGRYDARDGIVVDRTDGKLWQQVTAPAKMTHEEAVAYCETLHVSDRSGFRLPTVDELTKIRYKPGLIKGGDAFCVPSIDQGAFPDTPADQFWSSTLRGDENWLYTDFADGRSHYEDASQALYVRCVHDADPVAGR